MAYFWFSLKQPDNSQFKLLNHERKFKEENQQNYW